jgi:hypothetical protein
MVDVVVLPTLESRRHRCLVCQCLHFSYGKRKDGESVTGKRAIIWRARKGKGKKKREVRTSYKIKKLQALRTHLPCPRSYRLLVIEEPFGFNIKKTTEYCNSYYFVAITLSLDVELIKLE